MKLRHQIVALGLVGILASALVGGIGLFETGQLADAISETVDMSNALRNSQDADMMHDAIRGDVLLLVEGAHTSNADQMAEASKSLAVHAQAFETAIAELEAKPISAEVKTLVETTKPMMKEYIAAGKKPRNWPRKTLSKPEPRLTTFRTPS